MSSSPDRGEPTPATSGGARAFLRRLRLGLPLILGFGAGGYFIPYRLAGLSPARPHYPVLEDRFRAAEPEMKKRLAEIEDVASDLAAIAWDAPAPDARWNQDWFPWLDAALAYAMARSRKPRLWLEIGSGHSTRFVARAIKDGGLKTRLVAIDPAPRAALSGLAVEWRRSTLQQADRGIFAELAPGDVLFVDSSHVLMPGSDVDCVLNEILPRLPSGALLHAHDIFLPDAYPAEWAWRGYNEQNAIGALIGSDAWQLLASSHYLSTRMSGETLAGVMGKVPRKPAPVSSLWLAKR